MSKHAYLVKALRAYKVTTYGQFDREDHHTVQETQDAANAIEELERKNLAILSALNTLLDSCFQVSGTCKPSDRAFIIAKTIYERERGES